MKKTPTTRRRFLQMAAGASVVTEQLAGLDRVLGDSRVAAEVVAAAAGEHADHGARGLCRCRGHRTRRGHGNPRRREHFARIRRPHALADLARGRTSRGCKNYAHDLVRRRQPCLLRGAGGSILAARACDGCHRRALRPRYAAQDGRRRRVDRREVRGSRSLRALSRTRVFSHLLSQHRRDARRRGRMDLRRASSVPGRRAGTRRFFGRAAVLELLRQHPFRSPRLGAGRSAWLFAREFHGDGSVRLRQRHTHCRRVAQGRRPCNRSSGTDPANPVAAGQMHGRRRRSRDHLSNQTRSGTRRTRPPATTR